MRLEVEPYLVQRARWPATGRHVLAQFDDDSVVVYQAYRPSIGRFAAEHGYFGGDDFKLSRFTYQAVRRIRNGPRRGCVLSRGRTNRRRTVGARTSEAERASRSR